MDEITEHAKNLMILADAFDALQQWLKDELGSDVEYIPDSAIQEAIDDFWAEEGEIDFEQVSDEIVSATKDHIADTFMTKDDAIAEFKETILPSILQKEAEYYVSSDGKYSVDKPMRREAWNNFVDSLCKEGRITQNACDDDDWSTPDELENGYV